MHAANQEPDWIETPVKPGDETISEEDLSGHQLIAICINALRLGSGV